MKNLSSYFYKPKKRDDEIAKKRWNVPRIIWRAVIKTCTVIGAMILLSATISTILVLSAGGSAGPKSLPNEMVLVFNLEDGLSEVKSHPTLLDPFPFSSPTVRNTVHAIRKATNDDRVQGIVFRLNGAGLNVSHVQEIRTALKYFKTSGKFTKIYAPSYVDASGGLTQYYLASAFDEIWMQPVGMLSISGPHFEMPFAKDAMDKLGVSAQFLTREEFKSAMENFTDSEISDNNQQMLSEMLENLSQQMAKAIATDRKMNIAVLQTHVDAGLLSDVEALEAKLIDRLEYPDILLDEIRTDSDSDSDPDGEENLVSAFHYTKESAPNVSQEDVALIYVTGTIIDESDAQGNASGSDIASFIKQAQEDENIDVIIIRVDSPGGSPSASETIRRAIINAQNKGKKVVISMGPVAASGGYWLATHADSIVASSGTLTGSIGVVMGKFEASDLWDKVGVNWQGPQIGDNADLWSMNQPFDDDELSRMNILIDNTYDAFLTRVSEGRNMSLADVRQVAKGRVWTGQQARSLGLIDALGGLEVAKLEAAKLIGLENSDDINLVRFPAQGSKFEQFLDLVGGQVNTKRLSVKENKIYKSVQPYLMQMDLFAKSPIAVYDGNLELMR